MPRSGEPEPLTEISTPRNLLPPVGPTIPSATAFRQLLLAQTDAHGLHGLRRMVAAWQAVAQQCRYAADEVAKLATYRLEVERTLGAWIARSVRRGGRGSKSCDVTSNRGGASAGLPDDLTKQSAARYRQLAAIPDDVFAAYLQSCREAHRPPTASGARRFACPNRPHQVVTVCADSLRCAPGTQALAVTLAELPTYAIEAVTCVMKPDLYVGHLEIPGAPRIAPDHRALRQLRGEVFITECPDPKDWLPRIRRLHRSGRLLQTIVALPAEVWSEWFHAMAATEWTIAFLRGTRGGGGVGLMLAHQGARRRAFATAMQVRCETAW